MLVAPNRDRAAERREATRREILDAAWEMARESGLLSFTLRDVASKVGMRAPSLYSHFDSKMAIFDAMYAMAWTEYDDLHLADLAAVAGEPPLTVIRHVCRHFYEFATADLTRHQLMNLRIIPGFEPTPESYEPAVRVLERMAALVHETAGVSRDDFDVLIAVIAGLINQHHANDPDGSRYAGLLDRAMDMWARSAGLLDDSPPRDTPRKRP